MVSHKATERECPYPVVEVRGVSKQFPGVLANNDISLEIQCGEIHTILGENGAGKSTLMNILSGMLQPTSGEIHVEDQAVILDTPQTALQYGIGTVYQHFALVPNLSVVENMVLGMKSGPMLDLKSAEEKLKDLQKDVGIAVPPHEEVRFLSIGWQQRVEILKVLFRGSRILLLDEPTSVLTPAEVRELFAMLLRLKQEGVGVVFITHKLDEALEISDRVTILSQGRKVGEIGPDELAETDNAVLTEKIVATMFGEDVSLEDTEPRERDTSPEIKAAPVVVEVQDVTAIGNRGAPAVRGLSLEIRAGEIYGIAGVAGNGQKELAEVISGQRRATSGRILLAGEDITNRGTSVAYKSGISYITDDRLGEACVPEMSVAENLIIKVMNQHPFSKYTVFNRVAIDAHARLLINDFNVMTIGPDVNIGKLSGGNIQKLLLARELATKPDLLICNKPTHGLDVRTAQFVFETLRKRADNGMAILYISSELEELMALCDHIGVMYNGQLLDTFTHQEADKEAIGRLMLGVQT